MSTRFLAIPVALLMSGVALAQVAAKAEPAQDKEAASLAVGDKAPALTVEKWVKGSEVKNFEKGKVYIVEFWATWCGPCIQVQPHLSDLQDKYKDKGLTVIGMTSEDPKNSLEKVEKMVADRKDKMRYSVAWDKGRTTNKAFMDAAGQNGIPCAFVVNQEGQIAYIGHPAGMDEPLEQIIAGKYDVKSAAAQDKAARAARGDMMKLGQAMQAEDYKTALTLIDELEKKPNLPPQVASQLGMMKFHALLKSEQYDKAYAFAREASEKQFAKDANALNAISWTILDEEGVSKRDLDLALDLAKKAVDLDKENGMILDTLAYAHFQKSEYAKAVEVQRKAIEMYKKSANVNDNVMEEMKDRLTKFEEKAKKNN